MQDKSPLGVFLTDTHLFEKRTKADAIVDDNFAEVKQAFAESIAVAIANNLTRVYFLGDFFDSRKQQSSRLIEMVEEILALFEAAQIILVLIPGNHDKVNYDSYYSFLSPFRHHPFVQYFSNAGYVDEEGVRIHLIPFFTNDIFITELERAKSNLHPTNKNVLGTHIGIHGALKNSGEEEISPITFEMFAEFDKVLIGHYHNYSAFNQARIVYIGSGLQHNFGEDDNKGLMLMTHNLRLYRHKTNFKTYQTLIVNVNELTKDNVKDIIESTQQADIHQRLVITGDANLIKAFDKNILEQQGIKCTFKADEVDEEKLIELVAANVTTHTDETLIESFKQFCSSNEYDEVKGLVYLNPALNVSTT